MTAEMPGVVRIVESLSLLALRAAILVFLIGLVLDLLARGWSLAEAIAAMSSIAATAVVTARRPAEAEDRRR